MAPPEPWTPTIRSPETPRLSLEPVATRPAPAELAMDRVSPPPPCLLRIVVDVASVRRAATIGSPSAASALGVMSPDAAAPVSALNVAISLRRWTNRPTKAPSPQVLATFSSCFWRHLQAPVPLSAELTLSRRPQSTVCGCRHPLGLPHDSAGAPLLRFSARSMVSWTRYPFVGPSSGANVSQTTAAARPDAKTFRVQTCGDRSCRQAPNGLTP